MSETLHIGAQTRELLLDIDSVETAERLLGGKELRVVLFTERSKLNVFKIAAAGFSRPGKKVSPLDVKAWVKANPKVYPALEQAVMRGVAAHLLECGEISQEDARAMGEALGGSPAGDAAGSSGSSSPPASG